jgi:hypothetical protein
MTPRKLRVFVLHVLRVVHGGQVRFRLETFGVYYPSLPYQRPWWKVSWRPLTYLLRRLPAYARWLETMEPPRHSGRVLLWREGEPLRPQE